MSTAPLGHRKARDIRAEVRVVKIAAVVFGVFGLGGGVALLPEVQHLLPVRRDDGRSHRVIVRRRTSQVEAVEPRLNVRLADRGGEALALQPVSGPSHFGEQRSALTESGRRGGAERDDRLAGEVIRLNKVVYRPRGNAPPDRILKCSPSSLSLENTGLNGLHKCVFCSFLVPLGSCYRPVGLPVPITQHGRS